jgi:hypothetical protein
MNQLYKNAENVMKGRGNTTNVDADYQYYNVNIINNDEPNGKQLKFSENRVISVLTNPSQYKTACVRFDIPSINIPILFFNNYNFQIQLTYGITTITKSLIYIPNSVTNRYAPLLPIFDFNEINQNVNTALASAKADLDALYPALSVFDAPFTTYAASTELYTLNCEQAGYDNNLPNTIGINFSTDLNVLYANLQTFNFQNGFFKMIVIDTFYNKFVYQTKPYFGMVQTQPSLELWSEINKIIIFSNSIPLRQELQPTQDDVTQRVLFDFSIAGKPDRTVIQYFPQGPVRYYDLLSQYPLTQIDIEIRWSNSRGETFPIYINVGQNASVKIQFVKNIELRLEGE